MTSALTIIAISSAQTHAVRHPILRKGRPKKDCVFSGDELDSTFHLGAYHNDKLIGVLSAFKQPHPELKATMSFQIRGVAVMDAFQRQGVGQQLMHSAETLAKEKKADLIWLNARVKAKAFYISLGYTPHGEAFEIASIGTHFCFFKFIHDA
ncbi:MAG: GNAT family N-acetyltransferase [Flavobacteriaceae bacterium]